MAGGGVPPTPAAAAASTLTLPSSVAVDASGDVFFAAGNCVFEVDNAGVLTRIAGNSPFAGYSGDGGLATSARLSSPNGVAVSARGDLYIADTGNNVIRKVAAATGAIATVAGTGVPGYSGDGFAATGAKLSGPNGVAVDAAGNLYIADTGNNAIRKVALDGAIATFAGTGTPGFSGDGKLAVNAQIDSPWGVAVDTAGNLYIADTSNARIRMVALNGDISTVAGNGQCCSGGGDGGPATSAQLNGPRGVAVDAVGNFYIADTGDARIRAVATNGFISTAGGTGHAGYSGDGGSATKAELDFPYGVAVDGSGNLYIADNVNNRVRQIVAGTMTTLAGNGSQGLYSGDGGLAAVAGIQYPTDAAVDGAGNLYIADFFDNVIRKVAANGIITTVAGGGTGCPQQTDSIGDGCPATQAQLSSPYGVALDAFGNLYISDHLNQVIRKVDVDENSTITTVAGGGTGCPQQTDSIGDGCQATQAQLQYPAGVRIDAAGNLYIADSWNNAIRMVALNGIIATVAGGGTGCPQQTDAIGDGCPATQASLSEPYGLALDTPGNLYIADYSDYVVRKVGLNGTISTVAGNGNEGYGGDNGPATQARLDLPAGVTLDASGNLFIADYLNSAIRKVDGAGTITTVAGNGVSGYSGDGGSAASAQLAFPRNTAADASGNLYIADSTNNVIRLAVPAAASAVLTAVKTHTGNFATGQSGASYSVMVTNAAGAGSTSGTVTVSEIVPAGLTLASLSGTGWTCPAAGASCTRSDTLKPGSSYDPITVTVNVATDAPPQAINQIAVTGGGSALSSANDAANIDVISAPALTSPGNGAAGVAWTPALQWSASANATSYDVYFGTSSPPPFAANTTSTSYSPGTLTAANTYYWQIFARNGAQAAPSATWSFATQAATYSISGQVTYVGGSTGVSGAAVTLSGTQNSATATDANGSYSFSGLPAGGNYTVTPSLSGYTFTPPSQTFNNLANDQTSNFTAQPMKTAKIAKIGTYNAGQWYLDVNGNGTWDGDPPDVAGTFGAGLPGAIEVTGDWNGSGTQKMGVYYQGFWFLDLKGDGTWDGGVVDKQYNFGWSDPNVIPVVGDWNGDGRTKIGVYYQGFWYLDYDGNGIWDGGINDKAYNIGWPAPGVTPIVGDWSGSGTSKIGIYYYGFWYLDYDGDGVWNPANDKSYNFGWQATGVTPIMGDWNGDGRIKIGIYYYGFWYLDYDGNGVWDGGVNDKQYNLGWPDPAVTPVMGDWTGTGTTKIGVFYDGYWYLDFIGNGIWDGGIVDKAYVWGQAGDTPLVGAW
jgi:hypothetical protein